MSPASSLVVATGPLPGVVAHARVAALRARVAFEARAISPRLRVRRLASLNHGSKRCVTVCGASELARAALIVLSHGVGCRKPFRRQRNLPVGQGWLKAALLRAGYVLARIRPWLALPSLRVHRTPTANPLRRSDAASHLVQQARRRRTRRGPASPLRRNRFSDDIFETDRSPLPVGIPRLRNWLRARHIRGRRAALSRVRLPHTRLSSSSEPC